MFGDEEIIGMGKYVLAEDGKTPVLVTDLMEWGRKFETQERRVMVTRLPWGTKVSTVFLGLDHGFPGKDATWDTYKPVLWETMTFPWHEARWVESDCMRYASHDEAVADHKRMVRDAIVADFKSLPRVLWAKLTGSLTAKRKAIRNFLQSR